MERVRSGAGPSVENNYGSASDSRTKHTDNMALDPEHWTIKYTQMKKEYYLLRVTYIIIGIFLVLVIVL
jgi:hypothetical protein